MFDFAESDRFKWCRMHDDYLKDKLTGEFIYQMAYPSGPVPADIKLQACEFFRLIRDEKARIEKADDDQEMEEIRALIKNQNETKEERAARKEKARIYNDVMNEGGEGFNPYAD